MITTLPKHSRPREKLQEIGPENVTTTELLMLILGSGTKNNNVIEIAQAITNHLQNSDLTTVTTQQLRTLAGMGAAQACKIIACLELARRLHEPKPPNAILTSQDAYSLVASITSKQREHVVALYLNARREILRQDLISLGGLNYANLEPRDIFAQAIQLPCAYVILAHNHPSGDPKPSQDDLEFTEQIRAAGELLGVKVLDHLIVAKRGYFSFLERGLL